MRRGLLYLAARRPADNLHTRVLRDVNDQWMQSFQLLSFQTGSQCAPRSRCQKKRRPTYQAAGCRPGRPLDTTTDNVHRRQIIHNVRRPSTQYGDTSTPTARFHLFCTTPQNPTWHCKIDAGSYHVTYRLSTIKAATTAVFWMLRHPRHKM